MSNEAKEWLKEREAYEKELYADFINQQDSNPGYCLDCSFSGMFIEYLMSRMYHEGLPSKEPT